MRYLMLSFCLLLSTLSNADNSDDKRFIQVTGTGVIEAIPDYLQVNLSIQVTESNLKQAKNRVDSAMKKLLKTTADLNIEERDIDAAHISNQSQYEWRANQREYRGEQVSRNVNITLRDKEQYAELAHQLLMIKEVRIHGSQLKFNDRAALKNQAFVAAVKAARERAWLISRANDASLGQVLSIQEQGSHFPQARMAGAKLMAMESASASEPAPMLIQKQKIEATVVVRYELR